MPDHIQIAPFENDYKRLIQIDRQHPSKGITVFILKSDSEKQKTKKKSSESLKHLRNYCELVGIRLKIQVINLSVHKTYYDIIYEFVKYFLDEYPQNSSFLLNFGDETSIINLALLNAAEYVKTYFNVEIIMHVITKQDKQEFKFEYLVRGIKDLELDKKIDKKIIQFIKKKMIIKDIAKELEISLGYISKRFHQYKEKGLININGRDRGLTEFGEFILKILSYNK